MSDNWEFYFAQIEHQPASIFVDVGVHDHVPDIERPHLYWVLVSLINPTPDGMTSSAEAYVLGGLESNLAHECDVHRIQLVGRITTAGRREYYFYGPEHAEFATCITRAKHDYADYRCEIGEQFDPDWSHYQDFLYPDPEAQQTIENRKVVQTLQGAGDSLDSRRPVRHFLYFDNVANRAQYTGVAQSLGFTTECIDDTDGPRPHGLILERPDMPLDIDTVVLDLYRQAIEFDGEYDGWESPVVRGRTGKPSFWQRLFGKMS
jgi:hypothetical protein